MDDGYTLGTDMACSCKISSTIIARYEYDPLYDAQRFISTLDRQCPLSVRGSREAI